MAESHGFRTLLPLPFLNFLLIFHHSQLRFRSSFPSSHSTSPSSRNTNFACVGDIGCHQGSKRRQLGSLYSRCTFPWQDLSFCPSLYDGSPVSSVVYSCIFSDPYVNTTTCIPRTRHVQQANPIAVGKPVDRGDNYKIVAGGISCFIFTCLHSLKYSTKNLSFGIVDLGLFPNAAEKFGISLSGSMGQLPTYILFENAAEVARFPELDFEATYFHPTITKGLLSRHFELDRHLLEYFNGK
ncbi:uncharacterized protein LOC114193416 isoform X3 [Vigna unguiculata]|uniref:uncharacterized protein LOC114193416 isoform X3 n=1 Tax=Vigna unguiculata TaxID=3917 RepID=UPI001015E112|nr:uncharacterized protein LOC114193416 isoform X3 [Vigna unguiculata]